MTNCYWCQGVKISEAVVNGSRGRLLHYEQFAPFMAVYLLGKHQIFMLAFAKSRVEVEGAQVLVVSQSPP
jgi:hypothetical protein